MSLGLLCVSVLKNKESFLLLLFGVYGGAIFIFESAVLTPNLWNGSKWVCAHFAW